MKSGEALRAAQIAASNGRRRASRPTSSARPKRTGRRSPRRCARPTRLAGADGAKPDADELSRTLESLSLAAVASRASGQAHRARPPGRLRSARRSLGIGVLGSASAGCRTSAEALRLKPAEVATPSAAPARAKARRRKPTAEAGRGSEARAAEAAAERQREKELAAQKRKAEAALSAAEQDFERSKAAEAKAREALERGRARPRRSARSPGRPRESF